MSNTVETAISLTDKQVVYRKLSELYVHEACNILPPASAEDDRILFESMQQNGLLKPLDALADGGVVDGKRRFVNAEKCGLEFVPTLTVAPADPVEYVIKVNMDRRHFSEDDRALVAVRWQEHRSTHLKAERSAKAAHAKAKGSTPAASDIPKTAKADSRDEACERFNVPIRNFDRVKKISAHPDALKRMVEEKVSSISLAQEIRAEAAKERANAAERLPPPTITYAGSELENHIHCGDSVTTLRRVPDGVASLVLTSPHYPGVAMNYDPPVAADDYQKYLGYLRELFAEIFRVLRSGGRVAFNVDITRNHEGGKHYMYPLQMDVMRIADEAGLGFLNDITWDKDETAGSKTSFGSFGLCSCPIIQRSHEYILLFCKDRAKLDDDAARCDLRKGEFVAWARSVWRIRPEGKEIRKHHPCPMPEELAARLIKLYTYRGDLVIDPHNGSGTTCFCAQRLGRRYIGIDISEKYCAFARERIADADREIRWQRDKKQDAIDHICASTARLLDVPLKADTAEQGESEITVEAA